MTVKESPGFPQGLSDCYHVSNPSILRAPFGCHAMFPDGRCDVGSAEQSEDVYHDVSQSCHDLWRRTGPYLRAVLSHRHVPHIVQAVLYSPVAAYQLEQPISRCARSEAGDSVSHLPGQLVFDPTPTLHLHYLPMSGPVQICLQHVCGPQPAKLPTVCMPAHRLSIGVTFVPATGRSKHNSMSS